MPYHYDYTVIGGDMRQVYLTEELAKSSGRICHFALCGVPDERLFSGAASVTAAASLKEACGLSPCIIGPIPLCRNCSFLNQTAFPDPIPIDRLFSSLRPGQALFGGCIFPGQQTVLQEKGVRAFDLMEDLTFSYYNTIATAEGAICEAIRQSPYPKTYDPSYEKLLGERLKEVISDPSAPVGPLLDRKKVQAFLNSPSDYGKPWYGQLMAGPQMLAYMLQVNYWLEKYRIRLI